MIFVSFNIVLDKFQHIVIMNGTPDFGLVIDFFYTFSHDDFVILLWHQFPEKKGLQVFLDLFFSFQHQWTFVRCLFIKILNKEVEPNSVNHRTMSAHFSNFMTALPPLAFGLITPKGGVVSFILNGSNHVK